MTSYVEDNTSQGNGWIFNSGSMVHVCSQKELFYNSLVAKEQGAIIMVDGLACELIDTGIVKVTERIEMVRAMEAIRYVPEAQYNLISMKVLNEEEYQI